jgi:uncharacterized cupredoxin-like copper-binding protein
MRRGGIVVTALAALALVGAACSSGGSSKNETVKVGLAEYTISPNVQSVGAGEVTFDVQNDGTMTHEMVVVKAKDASGTLPVEKGEASEAGSVGEVSDLAAGKDGKLSVHLAPGTYVLLCNLPGHYLGGMHAVFTVS